MRGQELANPIFQHNAFIIPTRVGTSSCRQAPTAFYRDHPHAYGDKTLFRLYFALFVKSSPRVWGQDNTQTYKGNKHRIIPTRMGTSNIDTQYNRMHEDHPHAYGDKIISNVKTCNMIRIIPTRMGTSSFSDFTPVHGEDHPHAYGDKHLARALLNSREGSSPRVWGQALIRCAAVKDMRIIPTRMGTRYSSCLDRLYS